MIDIPEAGQRVRVSLDGHLLTHPDGALSIRIGPTETGEVFDVPVHPEAAVEPLSDGDTPAHLRIAEELSRRANELDFTANVNRGQSEYDHGRQAGFEEAASWLREEFEPESRP